jgi:hypothetical protein
VIALPTNTVTGVRVSSSITGPRLSVPFTVTLPFPLEPVPRRRIVTDVVPPAVTSKLLDPVKAVPSSTDVAVSVIV